MFSLDIEAFAAGGDDGELWAADEQIGRDFGSRLDQVLTVVEHQQPMPLQSADE